MNKAMIKIIALVVVLVAIIAGLTILGTMNIKIGSIETMAVSDIAKKKTEIVKLNDKLTQVKASYSSKNTELEAAKKEYSAEKAKYEAISDATISIIQEATKEEKYFIEYLWIVLGNYAKSHSLSLTVVDPGSKVTSDQSSTEEETKEENPLVTTIESSSAEATADIDKTQTPKTSINAKENSITIQLKGSYINVADFVFEVENDRTLRFKLDNISMKSAGGTDIIASFEVKNLVIIK